MCRAVNRGDHRAKLWIAIYRWLMRNGFEWCRLCDTVKNLTFEHIVPQSREGGDGIDNITILCSPCNNRKGNDYYGFDCLTWPPPQFDLVSGDDLKIGDWLPDGIILTKERHNGQWHCDLDRGRAMLKRRWAGIVHKNNQYLIVKESYYEDFKRVLDRTRVGQARSRAT